MSCRALLLFVFLGLSALACRPRGGEGESAPPSTAKAGENKDIEALQQRIAAAPSDLGLYYLLAVLHARAGEAEQAIQALETLDERGWTLGVDAHDFRSMRNDSRLAPLALRLNKMRATRAIGKVRSQLGLRGIYPEGIAWDAPRDRFYIGDAPARDIVVLQADGQTRSMGLSAGKELYAPLGMRVDAQGKILWVATAAFDLMEGFAPELQGRSALVAIDLESERVVARFEQGESSEPSLFNDVAPLGDGRAVVTDSLRGRLYLVDPKNKSITTLAPEMDLDGPNGVTFDPVGERVIVADSYGLSAVDLGGANPRRLQAPSGEHLGGVDGLLWAHGRLYGVQNAVGALRIWSVGLRGDSLDDLDLLSSADSRLGSVTTLALNAEGVWLIADPQFRHYNAQGRWIEADQLPQLELFQLPLRASPAWEWSLLERARSFHDPEQRWASAKLALQLQEPRIANPGRYTQLRMDNASGRFQIERGRGKQVSTHIVDEAGQTTVLLDGSERISKELQEKYRLDPARNLNYREFYAMMYGLPMSLNRESVASLANAVRDRFDGHEAYRIDLTLRRPLISAHWSLFVSRQEGRVLGLEIRLPGQVQAGERIVFRDLMQTQGMRLPRVRHWHDLANGEYSGSDLIIGEL